LAQSASRTHDQNANRYCCCGRGGTFVCATGVATIELEPDFNTLKLIAAKNTLAGGAFIDVGRAIDADT